MPRRRPNYDRKLARRIVLEDGRALLTLQDAANLLLETFGTVNTRGGALDHAIAELIVAATTGKRVDHQTDSECGSHHQAPDGPPHHQRRDIRRVRLPCFVVVTSSSNGAGLFVQF
jgi:hypothetical protein